MALLDVIILRKPLIYKTNIVNLNDKTNYYHQRSLNILYNNHKKYESKTITSPQQPNHICYLVCIHQLT